jgi:uncharacterized protein (TIGR03437 family)
VLSTGASLAFSAGAAVSSGGNWLSVGPAGGSTPATLSVSVNPAGLAAGEYTGTITITSAGVANSPIPVAVTLTVRGSSQLAATPSALAFHFQTEGAAPPNQTLTLTSNGSPLSYTLGTSGGSWLLANPAGGTTTGTVQVSVNVAGLAAGTYNGSITIVATGAANSPVTVPVSLTVSPSPRLAVSPGSLAFFYQIGGSTPGAQSLSVSGSGTAAPFTVGFTTSTGGSWLVPSPLSGVTPAAVSVAVNPAGLGAGIYSGLITITAVGAAGSPQNVAVTLVVTGSPLLTVSHTSLTFSYQVGGSLPASQSLGIGSSGSALSYTAAATAAGGAWLAVGPVSGTTSGSLTVAVSPAGLAPGTYRGAINLTAVGAGNSPTVVEVRLVVSFSPVLVPNPAALSFAYQSGLAIPAAQAVAVTSTGAPLSLTIAVATESGGNWLALSASTATTPASFTVSVAPTGLNTGTYNGSITLTSEGAGNSPVTISVRLVVSASALLVASPGSLLFDVAVGSGGSGVRNVSLTSTDGTPLNFTVAGSTSTGGPWLLVGPQSGSTPSTLSISVNAAGLAAGTYTGSVAVTAGAAANSPQTIAITLRVAAGMTVSASPATLSFTQATGGAPPAPVSIALTTSSGGTATFTATATTSSGGAWLSVAPSGGTTPATVSVQVNGGGLTPGAYSGQINIVSADVSNSPFSIPVSLVVGVTLASTANTLNFSYQIGSPPPVQQTFTLSAGGGVSLAFTATVSGGSWLSVTPAAGTLPITLGVSVNPAGLAAGTYDGSVAIVATGAVNSPLTISVRLVVTAAPALPFVRAVVNAASFLPTSLSPGQIVTLFGTWIGPASGVSLRLTAAGLVDTTLGETRVLFDGVAAPMIYASSEQVSAIVPYLLSGRFNARLQVQYQGALSNTVELRVVDATPAIFTVDSSGTGQGAILNQNFSVNGLNNPAARGSVVMIYATGEGQTNPGGLDGLVTGSVLRRPVAPITATIGGASAEVLYAGSAPGLVSGVIQINARVSETVPVGNAVPVVVTIGGVQSQAGVTMAVR